MEMHGSGPGLQARSTAKFARRPGTLPTSRGFTLIEIMIVISIIAIIMAIAQPAYKVYRENALTRACFKTQKTISSSLQNYNLDRNANRIDLPDVIPDLVAGGYLQSLPVDPGAGDNTYTNYTYTEEGFNVECAVHGILK